jgi:hypothetical protein
MTRDQPLARLEEADWRAVLDTGLDGMFHICRAAMFAMMKRRSGRIVAVSSVCGAYEHRPAHDRPAHDRPAHHWPVRAGIAGFVPALSALTSRFGVSVNAVTPGPATHDMTAILPELTRADLTETVALRRFDDASDVAELVAFLLSAACDITGRVLEVRSPISLLTQVPSSINVGESGRRARRTGTRRAPPADSWRTSAPGSTVASRPPATCPITSSCGVTATIDMDDIGLAVRFPSNQHRSTMRFCHVRPQLETTVRSANK